MRVRVLDSKNSSTDIDALISNTNLMRFGLGRTRLEDSSSSAEYRGTYFICGRPTSGLAMLRLLYTVASPVRPSVKRLSSSSPSVCRFAQIRSSSFADRSASPSICKFVTRYRKCAYSPRGHTTERYDLALLQDDYRRPLLPLRSYSAPQDVEQALHEPFHGPCL